MKFVRSPSAKPTPQADEVEVITDPVKILRRQRTLSVDVSPRAPLEVCLSFDLDDKLACFEAIHDICSRGHIYLSGWHSLRLVEDSDRAELSARKRALIGRAFDNAIELVKRYEVDSSEKWNASIWFLYKLVEYGPEDVVMEKLCNCDTNIEMMLYLVLKCGYPNGIFCVNILKRMGAILGVGILERLSQQGICFDCFHVPISIHFIVWLFCRSRSSPKDCWVHSSREFLQLDFHISGSTSRYLVQADISVPSHYCA